MENTSHSFTESAEYSVETNKSNSMTTSLYKEPRMKVKTKIINKEIPTAPLQYAKNGDAGIDLTATSRSYDEHGNVVYGTNRAFEIPQGYVGLLFPRSSNSKKDLLLSNSVGVLDSGYRGEVLFKFTRSIRIPDFLTTVKRWIGIENFKSISILNVGSSYEIGDRIGQLIIMPYPTIEFEESEELSETERGSNGYGSTGK